LVGPAGTTTDSYTLDAFGRNQGPQASATWYPFRFGGEWSYLTDPSGLLQLGARFYRPEAGRFIQQDPEGDGANWYAYVGNNPLAGLDPEGLYRDSIHRRDTARGARCAGLGGEAAKLMGFAAWWIDQQGWRSKMGPPHYGDQLGYAARQFRKAKLLYRRGRRRQAYVQLGFGAHAVQDFYSHQMPRGKHFGVTFLGVGGLDPDEPMNDPCQYNRAVGHLGSYLGQFAAAVGGWPYSGPIYGHVPFAPALPEPSWGAILFDFLFGVTPAY